MVPTSASAYPGSAVTRSPRWKDGSGSTRRRGEASLFAFTEVEG